MTDGAARHCPCPCHIGGATVFHVPPDVCDPVSAITACSQCLNRHTIALVSEWPPAPPAPNPLVLPWMDTYADDGEGKE